MYIYMCVCLCVCIVFYFLFAYNLYLLGKDITVYESTHLFVFVFCFFSCEVFVFLWKT
ncbi:hypothetical protein BDF14DRAFT_1799792 [Spinellus fusiger]|nr:hypothetical protein BDF14DRAFT_1799792 [Spinellus fusiger]